MHALNYTDLSEATPLAGDGGSSSSSMAPALVLATVAGYDYAVDGLPAAAKPLLQEAPPTAARPAMLVAATQLSGFARRRYGPTAAWSLVLAAITTFLNGGTSGGGGGGGGGGGSIGSGGSAPAGPLPIDPAVLSITPTVRPTFSAYEPLPAGAERAALERSVQWCVGGGMIPSRTRLVLPRLLRQTHSLTHSLTRSLAHSLRLCLLLGTWTAA